MNFMPVTYDNYRFCCLNTFVLAATNDYFGWTLIAALGFYGSKEEVEKYLSLVDSTKKKIEVAKDTQLLTKNTLIGTNFTAYGLLNLKTSTSTAWFAKQFISGDTISKQDYFELLLQQIGLFAIHEYIAAQIELKEIHHEDCQKRITIFSNILSALNKDSYESVMKVLSTDIPCGFFSTEFYDLVTAFKLLPYEKMQEHFNEYKQYYLSLDQTCMRELDKICISKLLYSKPVSYLYQSRRDNSSLFFALPSDVINVIGSKIIALDMQDVHLGK